MSCWLRAWRVIEPHFEQRVPVDIYGEVRAHGRGSDRLWQIAAAAAQNRVGTLLVEADRQAPGSADTARGTRA